MVDALRLHMRIKQAEKYAGGRENGLIVAYRPNSCPASDFFSSGHEWTDYCIWAESIPRVELPLSRTRVAPTTSKRSQPTLSMTYKSKSMCVLFRAGVHCPKWNCLSGQIPPRKLFNSRVAGNLATALTKNSPRGSIQIVRIRYIFIFS